MSRLFAIDADTNLADLSDSSVPNEAALGGWTGFQVEAAGAVERTLASPNPSGDSERVPNDIRPVLNVKLDNERVAYDRGCLDRVTVGVGKDRVLADNLPDLGCANGKARGGILVDDDVHLLNRLGFLDEYGTVDSRKRRMLIIDRLFSGMLVRPLGDPSEFRNSKPVFRERLKSSRHGATLEWLRDTSQCMINNLPPIGRIGIPQGWPPVFCAIGCFECLSYFKVVMHAQWRQVMFRNVEERRDAEIPGGLPNQAADFAEDG